MKNNEFRFFLYCYVYSAEKALEFDEHSVMCLLPRNSMNNIILKITISNAYGNQSQNL
jgi:hypothetical protein